MSPFKCCTWSHFILMFYVFKVIVNLLAINLLLFILKLTRDFQWNTKLLSPPPSMHDTNFTSSPKYLGSLVLQAPMNCGWIYCLGPASNNVMMGIAPSASAPQNPRQWLFFWFFFFFIVFGISDEKVKQVLPIARILANITMNCIATKCCKSGLNCVESMESCHSGITVT